jgi:hypothetical protein
VFLVGRQLEIISEVFLLGGAREAVLGKNEGIGIVGKRIG